MSDRYDHLTRLVHLASEPCSEKRRDLLRQITDVFMAEPQSYTGKQNWYFGEIMGQLAYDLEKQMREELAERLAAEGSAPKELIRRLASDDITVAQPVLAQSPVLSQDDLIEITQSQSQDHLRAITERPDIGSELSQSLVSHGDDTVVVSLLQNQTAEIRDDTMGQIAQRSHGNEGIQTALVDRRDVPKEVIANLMDEVSDKLREQILDRYADVGSERLADVLATMKEAAEVSPRSAAERYVDGLVRRGLLTEAVISRLIGENRPMEFLIAFARLMDVGIDDAQRILADETGTPLTVLCRANDISPETFKEMVLSPLTGISSQPSKALSLVRVYVRLKPENARRTVRFWKTRKLTLASLPEAAKDGATGGRRSDRTDRAAPSF